MRRSFYDIQLFERDRLVFTYNRDGLDGAIYFARQALLAYRGALGKRNDRGKRYGYGLAYREELVGSCIVFRKFLSHPRAYLQ